MKRRHSPIVFALCLLCGQIGFSHAQESEEFVLDDTESAVPGEDLSQPAREVIKLADSNTDPSVVLAYVNNSPQRFNLTANDLIYLRDLGIPSDVVTAMLERDHSIPNGLGETTVIATTQSPTPISEVATVAEPAAAVPQVQPFYDGLAPYGTWINIPGQGWAWQPNVVVSSPGWQPYSDAGHWLWTDCGWYWASDYSWGWAPFHYGRWMRAPNWGWVWFPDNRWAPSWVTWRTYGETCGWAPLPPDTTFVGNGFAYRNSFVGLDFDFGLGPECFTFVEFPFFLGHDFRHHRLDHQRVNQFFRRSSVVNHFSTADNNVVINHGLPLDRVRHATGASLRPVAVRDTAWNSDRRGTKRGGGETAFATRTALPRATTRSQTFVAQQVTPGRAIAPAVPRHVGTRPRPRGSGSLTSESRTQPAQTGPSLWNATQRNIPSNERQLWSGNREQSLSLPSQRRVNEWSGRRSPSEIREPSGATVPAPSKPTPKFVPHSRPNPSKIPSAPVREATPSVPRVQSVTPRLPSTPAIPQATPQHQVPRQERVRQETVVTPRPQTITVPPSSSRQSTPAPLAPSGSAWGRSGAIQSTPVPSSAPAASGARDRGSSHGDERHGNGWRR